MAMVQRLIYTSCRQSNIESGSGDRIFSITEGLRDKPEIREIMKSSRQYSLKSTGLSSQMTEDNEDQYPVAYRYFEKDGTRIISSIQYVGFDWSKSRQGNKLAQFMTADDEDITDYPIAYCNTNYFPELDREAIASEEIPDYLPEELDETDTEDLVEKISEFLENDENAEVFCQIVSAIITDPKQTIAIRDKEENLLTWVAAATLFFPLKQARKIFFNTYEDEDSPSQPTTLTCYISNDSGTIVKCSTESNDQALKDFLSSIADDFESYFNDTGSFKSFMQKNGITEFNTSTLDYLPLYRSSSSARGRPFDIDLKQREFVLDHKDTLDRRMLKLIALGAMEQGVNDTNIRFIEDIIPRIDDPELRYEFDKKKEEFVISKIRYSDELPSNSDAETYSKLLRSTMDDDLIVKEVNPKVLFIILKLYLAHPNADWGEVYLNNKKHHRLDDPRSKIIKECNETSDKTLLWRYAYDTPISKESREALERQGALKIKNDKSLFDGFVDFDRSKGYKRLQRFCEEHSRDTFEHVVQAEKFPVTLDMVKNYGSIMDSSMILAIFNGKMIPDQDAAAELLIRLDRSELCKTIGNGGTIKKEDKGKAETIMNCYKKYLLPRYGIERKASKSTPAGNIPMDLLMRSTILMLENTLESENDHYVLLERYVFDIDVLPVTNRRTFIKDILNIYKTEGLLKADESKRSCENLFDSLMRIYINNPKILIEQSQSYINSRELKDSFKKMMAEVHDEHLLPWAAKKGVDDIERYRIRTKKEQDKPSPSTPDNVKKTTIARIDTRTENTTSNPESIKTDDQSKNQSVGDPIPDQSKISDENPPDANQDDGAKKKWFSLSKFKKK